MNRHPAELGVKMDIETEYIYFPVRAARSEYVARRFKEYFDGELLDVGCFEAPLRKLLPDTKYTGVDVAGDPDIELNLERCERLPFDSASFNCVTCIDVLEHLNNLYLIFDELIRVSNRYIIISLPNCWRDARRPIGRGKGDFLHYGLPASPPVDRHKWFFNITQAKEFIEKHAVEKDLKIAELFVTEKPKNPVSRLARKVFYPGYKYMNRYAQTLWVVYEIKKRG